MPMPTPIAVVGERRPITPAADAPDTVGPAHEVAGQLHLRSNVPPPHLLKVMREGRVWRRPRRPRPVRSHYAQLADLMEQGSADDIDGFIGARYWVRKNGWHRQLEFDALSEAHA